MRLDLDETLMLMARDVLQHQNFNLDANFFLIGGTSLSAAIMVTKLEDALGHSIPVEILMQNPVLRSFKSALQDHIESGCAEFCTTGT